MKNKIIISFIGLVILALFVFEEVNNYIEELSNTIRIKNERIESLIKNDSIINEKTKEYSQVITKYIRDCNVIVDDKEYSYSEFIDMYILEIEKGNKIKDSLHKYKTLYNVLKKEYGNPYSYKAKQNKYQLTRNLTKTDTALAYFKLKDNFIKKINNCNDSLQVYKIMLESIERQLNIDANYKIENNNVKLDLRGIEKIDSALILLPYYRHRLSQKNNTWTIEVDGEYMRMEKKEKRKQKRRERKLKQ
jgi:hypothetical protein